MQKLVIFDMDGTLIDSKDDIAASINHVRSHRELPPMAVEEIARILNAKGLQPGKHFYGTEGYEERDRTIFEAHYYEQCVKTTRPYPGVRETLEALEASGALAVATNAPAKFAFRMLEHTGLLHFFPHLMGADMVEKPKPHPDMLHALMEKGKSKRPVMVGDSVKDMEAARNAGAVGVFVRWGFGNHEGMADHHVDRPEEIIPIVKEHR